MSDQDANEAAAERIVDGILAAREENYRERDRLWCAAIAATQEGTGRGRMVCDVETMLRWFNEHREDGGELHFGTSRSPELSQALGALAVAFGREEAGRGE